MGHWVIKPNEYLIVWRCPFDNAVWVTQQSLISFSFEDSQNDENQREEFVYVRDDATRGP